MNFYMGFRDPFLALVDDDAHSARLLTRMLLAHGAPSVKWHQSAEAAHAEISELLASRSGALPAMVLVDLKSSSTATAAFIAGLRGLERGGVLMVGAIAPSLDWPVRDALLDAGANTVFQRHADLEAYRRETANIVSFWVRNQRLSAVGT